MRIARVLAANDKPVWVELLTDSTGRMFDGSPLHGGRRTKKEITFRQLLAPLEAPLIIGIAQNYRAHSLEMNGKLPDRPVYFIKMPGSLVGQGDSILLPRNLRSDKVDYEAELAVIIGRSCHNVSAAQALNYVWGYTCANDVTARDWQKEWGGGQFCRGKGFDTFCPLGPWVVTRDAVPEPGNLRLRGWLNGELMQDSNTSDLIFPIPELIEFLSGSTTLPAGTVILTGTPAGVGTARKPPRYLRVGDTFTVEIESIGQLNNPVCEEMT